MTNIAINGLGRIGRAALKMALDNPDTQVAAANDLVSNENLAYLVNYDTVYGRYSRRVEANGDGLSIEGALIPVFHEKDPQKLPWESLDVDVVLECTGVFTKQPDLLKHIEAGAKAAILSAPGKGDGISTVVHGVNAADDGDSVISCASCTTNCIAPVVEVLGRRVGVKKANMTTIHAYTSSQGIVDSPASKFRRGRAGAANLVPTSTGAAVATTNVLPEYKGRFDGVAVRGPVPVGSLADVNLVTKRATSVEEVNSIFREEAGHGRYEGVLAVTEDPIVSSDVIEQPYASIVDLTMTQVVDGDLVKVMSWYDNEWGYASQLLREAVQIGARLQEAGTAARA